MGSPAIDRALVRHVAKLAALSLTDGEVDRLVGELGRVLEYVEQLGALDTSGVPPTAHVAAVSAPARPDEPVTCMPQREALSSAPEVEAEGFAVPPFVE